MNIIDISLNLLCKIGLHQWEYLDTNDIGEMWFMCSNCGETKLKYRKTLQ